MAKAVKTIKRLRKGRCIVILLTLIMLFSFLCGNYDQAAVADDGRQTTIGVMVKSGDTLWNIVQDHYAGSEDLRKIIYEVKTINALENANIYPGQIIYVPVR